MQYIRVEPERLKETALRGEEAEESYRQLVKLLYEKVAQLSEAWKGKDNLSFTSQIQNYEKDLYAISLIVKQYAEFLRNSARAYQETEQELSAEARRIL